MAGRPLLEAFSRSLADRYGTPDDPTGEDAVMDLIADGLSMAKVAVAVGCSSRSQLQRWVKAGGKRRQEKVEAARKASAESLVEDGMTILDDLATKPMLSQPEVSLGGQRANYRKWLGSVRNREAFGDEKAGVNVNLNIGALHLEALKAAGRMNPQVERVDRVEQVEEADFELLPAGDNDETVPGDSRVGDGAEQERRRGDRSPVRPNETSEPERD